MREVVDGPHTHHPLLARALEKSRQPPDTPGGTRGQPRHHLVQPPRPLAAPDPLRPVNVYDLHAATGAVEPRRRWLQSAGMADAVLGKGVIEQLDVRIARIAIGIAGEPQ